jgi:hypothetical protein
MSCSQPNAISTYSKPFAYPDVDANMKCNSDIWSRHNQLHALSTSPNEQLSDRIDHLTELRAIVGTIITSEILTPRI